MTFPPKAGTGIITGSSGFKGNLTQICFRGIKFIGNFGSKRCSPLTTNPILPSTTAKNHQIVFAHNFPKGLAGPFTQEKPARAVNSSTFVSSVGPVILPANAPLTKANPKLHSPANKPTGLSPLPITPVRAYILQFFLANYPPHCPLSYSMAFVLVFLFNFMVRGSPLNLLIS